MQQTALALLLCLFLGSCFSLHQSPHRNQTRRLPEVMVKEKQKQEQPGPCIHFLGRHYKPNTFQFAQKQVSCMHTYGYWRQNKQLTFKEVADSAGLGYQDEECGAVSKGFLWQYEYVALPNRCKLPPARRFSTEYLCKRLGGRPVFVIGDSMSFQFFISMINLLQYHLPKSSPFELHSTGDENNKLSQYYYHRVCVQCSEIGLLNFNLTYIRSDRLDLFLDKAKARKESIYPAPRFGKIADFHEYDYLSMISGSPDALLILNRGAHYLPTSVVLREVESTFLYLSARFPKMTLVWRTTASGHQAPTKDTFFETPLLYPPAYNELRFPNADFGYDMLELQNLAVVRMLGVEFPHVLFSDVFPATVLRRDSRDDELHYCIPGPTNEWVHLLFSSMMLVDKAQSFPTAQACAQARGA